MSPKGLVENMIQEYNSMQSESGKVSIYGDSSKISRGVKNIKVNIVLCIVLKNDNTKVLIKVKKTYNWKTTEEIVGAYADIYTCLLQALFNKSLQKLRS